MIVKEIECSACGTEYVLTFDESNIYKDPEYCPFCGHIDDIENFDDFIDTDGWE